MKEALICLVCGGILLVIGGGWLSVGITTQENADADNVLRSDFNASGVIESAKPENTATVEEYREDKPPILNPGKPALPCAECKDWTGQWVRGADGYDHFVIKRNGRDVTREVAGSEADMFSRTPLERR